MTELDGQLRRAETLERDVAQAVGAYTEARSTLARLRREREGAEASRAEGTQDRVAAAERRLEAAAGRVTALADEAGHLAVDLERTADELEASAREIRAGLPAGELGERGRPIPEVIQRDADRTRAAAARLRALVERVRRVLAQSTDGRDGGGGSGRGGTGEGVRIAGQVTGLVVRTALSFAGGALLQLWFLAHGVANHASSYGGTTRRGRAGGGGSGPAPRGEPSPLARAEAGGWGPTRPDRARIETGGTSDWPGTSAPRPSWVTPPQTVLPERPSITPSPRQRDSLWDQEREYFYRQVVRGPKPSSASDAYSSGYSSGSPYHARPAYESPAGSYRTGGDAPSSPGGLEERISRFNPDDLDDLDDRVRALYR